MFIYSMQAEGETSIFLFKYILPNELLSAVLMDERQVLLTTIDEYSLPMRKQQNNFPWTTIMMKSVIGQKLTAVPE